MKWFLVWFLGGWMGVIALACLLFLMARGRMRRHHRVDRKVSTGAPMRWMVDPRSPARLHRRLVAIGSLATAVAEENQPRSTLGRTVAGTMTRPLGRRPSPSPIAAAASELRAQAVATDRQLARIASLSPSARHVPLAALERRVAALESAATQLSAVSARAATNAVLAHDDPTIVDIQGQLDRLADAQRELDALDTASGLAPATSPLFSSPTSTSP